MSYEWVVDIIEAFIKEYGWIRTDVRGHPVSLPKDINREEIRKWVEYEVYRDSPMPTKEA